MVFTTCGYNLIMTTQTPIDKLEPDSPGVRRVQTLILSWFTVDSGSDCSMVGPSHKGLKDDGWPWNSTSKGPDFWGWMGLTDFTALAGYQGVSACLRSTEIISGRERWRLWGFRWWKTCLSELEDALANGMLPSYMHFFKLCVDTDLGRGLLQWQHSRRTKKMIWLDTTPGWNMYGSPSLLKP